MYDPQLGRFMAVDELWGEQLGINSYHYGINNPLYYKDISGYDFIALQDANGASGYGHSAVLIGRDKDPLTGEGGWTYISKNGTQDKYLVNDTYGDSDVTVLEYATLDDFRKGEGMDRYEKGFYIYQPDQCIDLLMIDIAEYSAMLDYNIFTNSCIDVVSDALEVGGFDGGRDLPWYLKPRPNSRYDMIYEKNLYRGIEINLFPEEQIP